MRRLNEGVDWIAVSFVQRADDVAEVKKIARGRALVLAKIEKPQAIARLDEIIEVSDALMVARGDLGVEMPLEKVPGLQKRITRMARRLGKPVVVATQMLESMITSPVPTRAEVSDVAQAVFEGADAVMLSAESASGQFPVEAVATMNRIAEEVERDPLYPTIIAAQRAEPERTGADAIALRGPRHRRDARSQGHRGLDGLGLDGPAHRPRAPDRSGPGADAPQRCGAPPVLAWGVHAVVTEDAKSGRRHGEPRLPHRLDEGFAKAGDRVIVVAGVPLRLAGSHQQHPYRLCGTGREMMRGLPVAALVAATLAAGPARADYAKGQELDDPDSALALLAEQHCPYRIDERRLQGFLTRKQLTRSDLTSGRFSPLLPGRPRRRRSSATNPIRRRPAIRPGPPSPGQPAEWPASGQVEASLGDHHDPVPAFSPSLRAGSWIRPAGDLGTEEGGVVG